MKIVRYASTSGAIEHAQLLPDSTLRRVTGSLEAGFRPTDEPVNHLATMLAPVAPVAILCTGLNYRKHAEETGAKIPEYPVLFMKAPSAVQRPGGPIVLPRWMRSAKVDWECELAIVIGKTARNVPRARALEYVAGYTCANDVSARDWQKEGGGSQWCRGKTFDTFCPLGPSLVTPDELKSPQALRIRTLVDGEVMQDSTTADMIFDVATLIEFYSGSTTLLPGTVILTGTPSGVGAARNPPRFLQPGQTVSVEIEGIGTLSNPVVEEPASQGGSEFTLG